MRVISDLPLRLRWQNKSRDIHYIVRHLTETLGTDNLAESHLQVANELFYRNKAAWLVGKLITPSGTLPFLLPIHQTDDGELFIDTCLTTTAEASIVSDDDRRSEHCFWLCAFLFYGLCTAARSAGRVATGNSAR